LRREYASISSLMVFLVIGRLQYMTVVF
jgi:hypothetical protein